MNILTINTHTIHGLLERSNSINERLNSDESKRLHALILSLYDTAIGSSKEAVPRLSLTAIQEELPGAIKALENSGPEVDAMLGEIKHNLDIQ
jgi:hypothetical protein